MIPTWDTAGGKNIPGRKTQQKKERHKGKTHWREKKTYRRGTQQKHTACQNRWMPYMNVWSTLTKEISKLVLDAVYLNE